MAKVHSYGKCIASVGFAADDWELHAVWPLGHRLL